MTEELPEGWKSFTAALPQKLYARLVARAEAEGADVLTEAAYLLAYALDNAPSPSEADRLAACWRCPRQRKKHHGITTCPSSRYQPMHL